MQPEESINASYESLEKFYKSNLETLRISDTGLCGHDHSIVDRNCVAENNYHQVERSHADEDPHRRRNAAAMEESIYETLDEAVSNSEKQRQLSDWYYIKTSPKPRQWNNNANAEWRGQQQNGKVDYLEQYPLKSSSTAHFQVPATEQHGAIGAFTTTTNGSNRDPRRLPHPPEIDVPSSRMYQNLVLNRVHSLPRQEDQNSTPSTSVAAIKHSFDGLLLSTQPNFLVNSSFIQSESNLKDFHFYENLIEQKKKRLPPPAFVPQSPVSINIVEKSTTTTNTTSCSTNTADATKVSHVHIACNSL